MMHHQYIDDFSVTDVRHTLQEIWRVLVARKWYFVFPFCIVSAIACAASLWAPRLYSGSTVIRREPDPVFASLRGKNWIQPYDDIRRRMSADISDPRFIERVLGSANLPVGAERFPDGTLSPAGEAQRAAMARQIAAGITVKSLEGSDSRDVVQISLRLPNPVMIPDLLNLLRESYMEYARTQTVDVLQNVRRFLQSEATRCEEELARLQTSRAEMELKYPGIDPVSADPLGPERTAIVIERIDIQRRIDELIMKKEQLESRLATLKGVPESEDGSPAMVETVNPRYTELLSEIKQLEAKIALCRTRKGMTEAHPEVRAARSVLVSRQAELDETPRQIVVPAAASTDRTGDLQTVDSIQKQLAEMEITRGSLESRRQSILERLADLDQKRLLATERRPLYTEVVEQMKHAEARLAEWRKDITPIDNVLNLEDKGRSVHFSTVKEPTPVLKPDSPDAALVLAICFGIGIAVGVVTVVIVELCDHSYRTVKQLSTALGIPVIESVDEIITAAVARRRVFRGLVLMPALAVMLVMAVSFAGTMAYFSIERPDDFAAVKATSISAFDRLTGRG